jgi:tetratricopeptide (TPR) repeat protein
MMPLNVEQSLQLAAQHGAGGRLRDAEAVYRAILAADPNHPQALKGLGATLLPTGRTGEAVTALRRAAELQPQAADIHNVLGQALQAAGRLEDAIAAYNRAIALRPGFAWAITNLGTALDLVGKVDQAIECFRQAIALAPGQPTPYFNLGCLLQQRGALDEAISSLRRAIALAPGFAEAHSSLADALAEAGDLNAALAECRQALALQPESPATLTILGTVLVDQGKYDEAMRAFDRALAAKPDCAEAEWCRATLQLTRGQFLAGWRGYEARWRVRALRMTMVVSTTRPRLEGDSPLKGKRVLLNAEQGLGDTIQFIRYAALIAERGGEALLDCQPVLKRLMQRAPGVTQVMARGIDPLPAYDLICPLLSLPSAFKTTLETIPATIPYLSAEPVDVERWRARVSGATAADRLKVGIAWGGNPSHRNERRRSLSLQSFSPLGAIDSVQFFSVQKGPAAAQLSDPAVTQQLGMNIVDWTAELNDFADTAALVANLDLIISVDTSVAHLAGALGKPTWVLLPTPADYRWMLDRSDSPWYPTMRLFRQPSAGNWNAALVAVTDALHVLVAEKRAAVPSSGTLGKD